MRKSIAKKNAGKSLAPILPRGGLRIDPPMAMLPMFSPRQHNTQRIMCKSTVRYDGTQITAHFPEMDQRDQSLLLALVVIATKQGNRTVTTVDDGLKATGKITAWPTVDISISQDELIRMAGWTHYRASKYTYRALDAALIRLHQVVISATDLGGNKTYATNLIAASQKDNGQLTIRLSGRIAGALCGGHHIRLLMHERATLKAPTAQIMHTWLSGWCRGKNKALCISLEKLSDHIWRSGELGKKRLRSLRSAIAEINTLADWDIRVMSGRGAQQIIRVRHD